MRRLVLVSLSAFVGAVLAITILRPISVRAVAPSGNGDVNGDGTIDISDAVYTLLYLFKGGDPPVACAGSPGAIEDRVAALEGRVTEIETCSYPDRFEIRDEGVQVWFDKCTGLTWLQAGMANTIFDLPGRVADINSMHPEQKPWSLATIDQILTIVRDPRAELLRTIIVSRPTLFADLPGPGGSHQFGVLEHSNGISSTFSQTQWAGTPQWIYLTR